MRSINEILGVIEECPATCETHGEYTAVLLRHAGDNWTGCPKCAEEIIERDRLAREEAARREQSKRTARIMLAQTGIPKRFVDTSISSYDTSLCPGQGEAARVALGYATTLPERRERGDGLLFVGDVGTGKTHLATSIAKAACLHHQIPARYVTARALLMRIKATYSGSGETEDEVVREYSNVGLLVLDELGGHSVSDHDLALLTMILSERHEECRPTVLVTNLSPAELRSWIGIRVYDRLRQAAQVVSFDWGSYRGGDA